MYRSLINNPSTFAANCRSIDSNNKPNLSDHAALNLTLSWDYSLVGDAWAEFQQRRIFRFAVDWVQACLRQLNQLSENVSQALTGSPIWVQEMNFLFDSFVSLARLKAMFCWLCIVHAIIEIDLMEVCFIEKIFEGTIARKICISFKMEKLLGKLFKLFFSLKFLFDSWINLWSNYFSIFVTKVFSSNLLTFYNFETPVSVKSE